MNSEIRKATRYLHVKEALQDVRESVDCKDNPEDVQYRLDIQYNLDNLEHLIDAQAGPRADSLPNLSDLLLTRKIVERMADLLVSMVLHDEQETARNNGEPEFHLFSKDKERWKLDATIWTTQCLTEIALSTNRTPIDIVRGVADTSGIPLPTIEHPMANDPDKTVSTVDYPKIENIPEPRGGKLWERVADCLVFELLGHGVGLGDDGDLEWPTDIAEYILATYKETPALKY